ncbi:SPP1 family predicted phage head-tail adaptor [Paenibacillus sp. LBL]|uniref:phage head closure protein n=1 Tax=Paenibacillus sp. LBL TaxID=2940563 RepID=UPI002473573D|nr:phage head closure protein [Paenibacillus sp. LBL]MDH6670170.1 SPP1 family predicted phage head-tail adaptor [Paenibacillus sp. LBL]
MSYDHELILITPGGIIEDDIGNQIPIDPARTPVYCELRSVGRNEFYNAAVTGLRPEFIFVIHGYEYNGEQTVEFEGGQYRVLRTYSNNFEEIELTVERVAADG